MGRFFLILYYYFSKHKILFFSGVIVIFGVSVFLALKLNYEEDIIKFIPKDKKIDKFNYVMQNLNFKDKLIVCLSAQDSSSASDPGLLTAFADTTAEKVNIDCKGLIHDIYYRVPEEQIFEVYNFFYQNLPLFLNEEDYKSIDSLFIPGRMEQVMEGNYKALISPASIVFKKFIANDPAGITRLALKKLQSMQADENYDVYDNYIVTKDRKNVLLFITSAYPSNETSKNAGLIKRLDKISGEINSLSNGKIRMYYYGAIAVGVSNANRLKMDTNITFGIVMLLMIVLLSWYYRKKTVSIIIMLPVIFGLAVSLAVMFLLKSTVSAMALGSGSIVIGIAINYSIHVFTNYKHTGSAKKVIRELASPMTIGSFTTIGAFFCLIFVKSEALRDFGLFSGFTLIGACLFSLIVMPHLLGKQQIKKEDHSGFMEKWLERVSTFRPDKNKFIIASIFILSIIFLFISQKVGFETNLSGINYLNKNLTESEAYFNKISDISKKSIYLVATGKNMNDALEHNENMLAALKNIKKNTPFLTFTSAESLILSESSQKKKIDGWNNYWTPGKKELFRRIITTTSGKYKFKKEAFASFYQLLDKQFAAVPPDTINLNLNIFLQNWVTKTPEMVMISAMVKVDAGNLNKVTKAFSNDDNIVVFDRNAISSKFIDVISSDFNLILIISSLLVFFTLFLTYGRIELTLIAFLPMLLSWVWIVGLMGIFGLEFNIVNIIISAFIFGLGDDFSIFIMDGLLQEYKTGTKTLSHHKTAIFLSAFTIILGFGSLLFAKHPALKSIALITVIGMFSVVFMAVTVEPFLFRLIIGKRQEKKRMPISWYHLLVSSFAYGIFIAGSFLGTMVGFFILKLTPISEKKKKFIFHSIIRYLAKTLIYIMVNVKKRIVNPQQENFIKPAVIIANHQSHIDIPFILMLKTKLVVLTNDWVQDNVFYGKAVKLADFYPVSSGIDNALDFLASKVKNGYSIVVYPEGTRSITGKIKRFHKGAFYIAEKLNLDILPLVLHGTGHAMTKGDDFVLKNGTITMKVLDRIKCGDPSFGTGFNEMTKAVETLMKNEYQSIKMEIETPRYFRNKLIKNYLFKGPVLEWYLRIKLRLEKNYNIFNEFIPNKANITDIGCGYGFMPYMLTFLSENRKITAIDYDEEKIELANHCFSKNERVEFICADATSIDFQESDIFIISDMLHYIPDDEQEKLIMKCINKLNPGGKIIIRDADSGLKKRHLMTRYTEFFSTGSGFNKARYKKLFFVPREKMEKITVENNMELQVIDNSSLTSNLIFVISHKSTPIS